MTTQPGLSELVGAAVLNTVTPEYIETKVQKHVDRLVDDAIQDSLRSYSDTGQLIKKKIGEALAVTDLDLPNYGHVVCQILEAQIQKRVAEVVAAKLTKDMDELLNIAPKRVKLSEIIAELLGDAGDEDFEAIHLAVEWDRDWCSLAFQKGDAPRSKYNSDFYLHVSLSKKVDDYERDETPEGVVSFGTVKACDLQKDTRFGYGQDPRHTRKFGRFFAVEQKILAMYAVGTVIEIDEDNCILDRDY